MDELVKYISPSSFYYWEKCPLRAVYSKRYNSQRMLPKHPDADLGNIIHSFYENLKKWGIDDYIKFENKWNEEVQKINESYKLDNIQHQYYPLEWNSKFYAVKKYLLRLSLLKSDSYYTKTGNLFDYEKWIDDEDSIGGKVDLIIYNEKHEISEIVDFKSGSLFEFKDKKKRIKLAFHYQMALYAYIAFSKQRFIPDCYLQDIKGERHQVLIDQEYVVEIYQRAVKLKNEININIETGYIDNLANPSIEVCSFCDYRPICETYKKTMINKFTSTNVDVLGMVRDINKGKKLDIKIEIDNRIITLKNIISIDEIKIGDEIFVFNLFCPDEFDKILFALKNTVITHG